MGHHSKYFIAPSPPMARPLPSQPGNVHFSGSNSAGGGAASWQSGVNVRRCEIDVWRFIGSVAWNAEAGSRKMSASSAIVARALVAVAICATRSCRGCCNGRSATTERPPHRLRASPPFATTLCLRGLNQLPFVLDLISIFILSGAS